MARYVSVEPIETSHLGTPHIAHLFALFTFLFAPEKSSQCSNVLMSEIVVSTFIIILAFIRTTAGHRVSLII